MRHVMRSWFPFVQRTRGEDIGIPFARVLGTEARWFDPSHAEYDGVGAFVMLQGQLGRAITVPTARRAGTPGLEAWRELLRHDEQVARLPNIAWRGERAPGTSAVRAFRIVAEEAARAIHDRARTAGVSTNSWAMFHAARQLTPLLYHPPYDRIVCTFPVNTRPPGTTRLANSSAPVNVELGENHGPADLHRAVRDRLASQLPFAADRFMRLVGWLPRWFLERSFDRDLRRLEARGQPLSHFLLSNLGSFAVPDAPPDEAWVFLPPPLELQPFVLGMIEFNGKLAFAASFHRSCGRDPGFTQECVDRWLDVL